MRSRWRMLASSGGTNHAKAWFGLSAQWVKRSCHCAGLQRTADWSIRNPRLLHPSSKHLLRRICCCPTAGILCQSILQILVILHTVCASMTRMASGRRHNKACSFTHVFNQTRLFCIEAQCSFQSPTRTQALLRSVSAVELVLQGLIVTLLSLFGTSLHTSPHVVSSFLIASNH